MELLVTHPDNPRSLAWVAQTLRSRLLRMEHLADGATHALAAQLPTRQAQAAQATDLWPVGQPSPAPLLKLLASYQQTAQQISDGLSALFFTHSGPPAHSVSL